MSADLDTPDDIEQEIAQEERRDRRFVSALARGMAILRCFKRSERWLANSEIATRTGLPRPTISRLTYTLTRLGYLEHSTRLEKYALGAGVLALGHAYLAGEDVRGIARPLMQALADEVNATVLLGALDQTQMVLVEVCHGSEAFHLKRDVGQRVPHGATALGRAYLMGLSGGRLEEAIQNLRAHTPEADHTAFNAGIRQAMTDFKDYGLVFSLGDWNREVYAAAVPLALNGGERIMAISVSGPIYTMTRDRLINEVGPRLRAARDSIQRRILAQG